MTTVLVVGVGFDGGGGTLGGAVAGVPLLGALQNVMSVTDVFAQPWPVVTGVVLALSAFRAVGARPRAARRPAVVRDGRRARAPG